MFKKKKEKKREKGREEKGRRERKNLKRWKTNAYRHLVSGTATSGLLCIAI